MEYQIGQRVPLDYTRTICGDPLKKRVWHAIVVAPQKERAMTEMFKKRGFVAFYPKREVKTFRRGKKHVREIPQITRIIYVRFDRRPNWDVMKERGHIVGVFSNGETPISIPSEIIRRLQGLPGRAEALRLARAELNQIVRGDTVRVASGVLEGHFVQVTDVDGEGRVFWNSIGTVPIRGSTKAGLLEKEGAASEAEIQALADELMEGDQQDVA